MDGVLVVLDQVSTRFRRRHGLFARPARGRRFKRRDEEDIQGVSCLRAENDCDASAGGDGHEVRMRNADFLAAWKMNFEGLELFAKRGILGTRIIRLTPESRIQYKIIKVHASHMHGLGIVIEIAASRMSRSQSNNHTLIVETSGKRMRITSSVKNVHLIADFLEQHEIQNILPGFVRCFILVAPPTLVQRSRILIS